MRFCFLGSGSSGNAYIVQHEETTILVDCGFTRREMHRRLARAMVLPEDISALLISHEHSDHTKGLKLFASDGLPLHMTDGTAGKLQWAGGYHLIRAEAPFTIGGVQITPVAVPHDVAEPVQFVFDDGARRLGVFTDLGHVTDAVRQQCNDLDALVVECNYCSQMLAENQQYPPYLKERIAGRQGHLGNDEAAAMVSVAESESTRLRHVVAAHLSAHNNTASLARQALSAVCDDAKISVATQADGTGWLAL